MLQRFNFLHHSNNRYQANRDIAGLIPAGAYLPQPLCLVNGSLPRINPWIVYHLSRQPL
jgi:hypothetical protein